jgi:hypothetical protein
VNSSEALKARRDAERAERRRNERLQERADEQAERDREDARAEERRQEEAREEAAARAAEEQARERREERLVQLRKARLAAARESQALAERRLLAAAARRIAESEQAAAEETRRGLVEERQERAREEERQAGRRAAVAERLATERRTEDLEAQRREQQLEEQRRRLADDRRVAEERSAAAERSRAEAAAQAREARLRELLAVQRRAELRSQARATRLRELADQRAAADAAAERAAELRAREAARREDERRALAAQEARERDRRAAAGSARRSEREAGLESTELPWLRTEDGRILAWGGERVLLRGVVARGLDQAVAAGRPLRETLGLGDTSLQELSERWGANLVRLPFAAPTIASADLTELDDLIGALSASGVYTLLALEPPLVGVETPLPDASTLQAWRLLADRYQTEPGVLFEPYAATAPLADGWPRAALALVRAIRGRHQSSLLLLPQHGGELERPVHNLAYTVRLVPGSRARLDERFAAFAARVPVLVSEWREDGLDAAVPATTTAGLLERHELSWCADVGPGRLDETRFGLAVRRALAAPVPPALTPF